MHVPRSLRFAALLASALLLVAAGCNRGDDDPSPAPTDETSPSPSVDAAGDFQLVGNVEHALSGQEPDIDLPSGTGDDSLGSTSTASPAATAAAGDFQTPPVNGVMRINLDDASDDLEQTCSADRDEDIEVFWTTSTEFSPRLITGDIEETLDARLVGVTGNLYVAPDGDDDLELGQTTTQSPGSPSATTTPDAVTAADRGCILVADQVATSEGTIPTPRPRATARPTTTPAPTRSPTPAPTRTASPAPTTTATASAAPTATASPPPP